MSMQITVFDTRRRKLRELIDDRYKGVTSHFADALGVPATQVYRWLSVTSKRPGRIDDTSARRIEACTGLAEGWLDGWRDGPNALVSCESVMLAVGFVRDAELKASVRFTNADFASLVLAVAEWASELQEHITSEDERKFQAMLNKLVSSLVREPS